jgi:hypothetical protein
MSNKNGGGRPHLRVVSSKDGPVKSADPLFADYGPVAEEKPMRRSLLRRPASRALFARIPKKLWLKLYEHKVGDAAWACAMELDHIVFRSHKNPVHFSSSTLNKLGLTARTRSRALRALARAGVIQIRHVKKGMAPLVLCLWHPRS